MTHLTLCPTNDLDEPGEFDSVMDDLLQARSDPARFSDITGSLVSMVSMHEVYPPSAGLDPDVDDGLPVTQVTFPEHEFTPEQNREVVNAFLGYGINVR
jgi:hypothetical protein